ncbi:hypothetical protein RB653_003474 [Dictyostelium firmibasis]|uniref:Uncharacterized protein n=1 Tax=Dictyostelium firmibasis TaxID=79012 RepID=A0AAN7TXW4_9MYCE
MSEIKTTPTIEKKKRNKGQFVFKEYTINQELSIGQKVGTDALLIAGYTCIARYKPYNLLKGNENSRNNQLNRLVFGESDTPYDYNQGKNHEEIINYDEEQEEIWPKYILDIGTGTNVLSIMMGQRFRKSIINSIDIDDSAIAQAKINIDTIFKQGKSITDRNYLFHTAIQDFKPNNFIIDINENKKHVHAIDLEKNEITIPLLLKDGKSFTPSIDGYYDLIISAPPYFPTDPINDLVVSNMQENRRVARHTHTLTMDDLIQSVKRLLRPDIGLFTTIVSVPDPAIDLELAAKNHGFICLEIVDVSDTPQSKIIRKMYTFKFPSINNNNNNNNNDTQELTFAETVKRKFSIYETSIKESTIRNHRKHSNQYKWMLNDFCNHFLKEEFLSK